jgi:hypothetical protein
MVGLFVGSISLAFLLGGIIAHILRIA